MKNALELQNVSKSFKGFETKDHYQKVVFLDLSGRMGQGKVLRSV